MSFPPPKTGLVIRYSYLWREEYLRGQEEGIKDRPCAVILAVQTDDGDLCVTVLPITHTPPFDPDMALEIPLPTKQRLGLDEARSWVVLSEANRFIWPGPDLRPMTVGDSATVAYGQLPYQFVETLRLRFVALLKARKARTVQREE
jgi:hypothetical protein